MNLFIPFASSQFLNKRVISDRFKGDDSALFSAPSGRYSTKSPISVAGPGYPVILMKKDFVFS
jgi:hypothetical protein